MTQVSNGMKIRHFAAEKNLGHGGPHGQGWVVETFDGRPRPMDFAR